MTVGDRIRVLRENKQITQEELAKHIDSTKQTIHKYENNIVTNIPSDKIETIASVLGASPAYIMGWTENINGDVKHISQLYSVFEKLDLRDNEFTNEEIENITKFIEFIKTNKK